MKVHAEIEYVREEDNIKVHSDICPPKCDPKGLSDPTYRQYLHDCLDEWLDKSRGTCGFYIKDASYHFDFWYEE